MARTAATPASPPACFCADRTFILLLILAVLLIAFLWSTREVRSRIPNRTGDRQAAAKIESYRNIAISDQMPEKARASWEQDGRDYCLGIRRRTDVSA